MAKLILPQPHSDMTSPTHPAPTATLHHHTHSLAYTPYPISIMDSTTRHIADYIASHKLLDKNHPVITGLSGGADSVALLAILKQLGYNVIACHCNFMLRGDESLRDRNHAARIASDLDVPFCETTFDTTTYAREKGISIEMAARELRYRWFEEMRIRHHADAIAVAHHRDDNIETLLLNLIRGTGIAGLTGMKPRNGYIVRPLLEISRQEILAFLSRCHLTYVNDSTNAETLYTRNKIRLEVLPLLRTLNPAVDESIRRTINNLAESEKVYRYAIGQLQKEVCETKEGNLYIDITQLQASPSPEALLFETLAPYGFNASQLVDILACCTSPQPGKIFMGANHRLVCDRRHLIVTPLPQTDIQASIVATWEKEETHDAAGITLSYHQAQGFTIPRSPHYACFDADRLQYPLTLRHWHKGDSFTPFGMKGSKKVSDFFSDSKMSIIEKEQQLLLCDATKILWVVGRRASSAAPVTSRTQRILLASIAGDYVHK